MTTEQSEGKEMGVIGRIVGIFSSPKETFESIDRKPTWLIPFIISIVVTVVLQFLILDIGIADRMEMMRAQEMSAQQLEAAEAQMAGPMRYIGIIAIPIVVLIIWAILAGILLFGGNTIMGGESKFKKMLSMVAWTSLIGVVGGTLKTLLILSKGTAHGVVTSLAILLPTPAPGQATTLYRLLDRFDVFSIWNLVLWIIGISVIYKFKIKKSATFIIILWAVYIVLAVLLGGVFGSMFGG